MKFNGNFEITRTLTAESAEVETTTTIDGYVNGSAALDVKSGIATDINFNDKKVTNTFSGPGDDATLVNQKYVHEVELKALAKTTAPQVADGKDKDVCFEGVLKDVPGALNEILPRYTSSHDYAQRVNVDDAMNIVLTKYESRDNTPHTVRVSEDAGETYTTYNRVIPFNKKGLVEMRSPSPKHYIAFHGDTMPSNPPCYSVDGGKTWAKSSVPSGYYTYGGGSVAMNGIVIKWGYNANVLYSHDNGKTFHESNFNWTGSGLNASGVVHIYNDTVIGIGQNGVIARSTDKGKTWTKLSTTPGNMGNIYSLIMFSEDKWIFSGTVGLRQTVNGGQTFEEVTHPMSYTKYIKLGYDEPSGSIFMTNMDYSNKKIEAAYSSKATWPVITKSSMDNDQIRPIDTYANIEKLDGQWAYGGHDYTNTYIRVLVFAPIDGSTVRSSKVGAVAGITAIHARNGDEWIPLSIDASKEADKNYVKKEGGEVGPLVMDGNLSLENKNVITNLSAPTEPTDLVPKSYVDSLLTTQSGTKFNYTITNTPLTIDTVDKDVETIRYTISAKKGNDQYFSQMNVIANGQDDPVSAEFGVITDSSLDIDLWVEKDGTGQTLLKAKSNQTTTQMRIKREIIDI